MPVGADLPPATVSAPLPPWVEMPLVLAVEARCPAIPTLTAETLPPGGTDALLPAAPSALLVAELQFCAVWFALRDQRSMSLLHAEPWVRSEAEAARAVFHETALATTDPEAAARASYLSAILDLVVDPPTGGQAMRAFVETWPESPYAPDAWAWIADRAASGCGGHW